MRTDFFAKLVLRLLLQLVQRFLQRPGMLGHLANLGRGDATCANVGKSCVRSGYSLEPAVAWTSARLPALMCSGTFGQGSMTRAGAQEGNRPESVTSTVTLLPG